MKLVHVTNVKAVSHKFSVYDPESRCDAGHPWMLVLPWLACDGATLLVLRTLRLPSVAVTAAGC